MAEPVMITDLPDLADAEVVLPAPAPGPGNWTGAADVILVDGVFWLSYRVRRPLQEGRGRSVVVARSADGVHFTDVAEIGREEFGAASLERPALLPLADGSWRLFLSCSTPGSKHWWIEALDAPSPAELPDGRRQVVLPGSDSWAVKDPVVRRDGDRWRMWLCCHPLDVAGDEDKMSTSYLTSADGLRWTDLGTVLAPRPDEWDARGARVATVLTEDPLTVLYDGRATAAANWYETTGIAVADSTGVLRSVSEVPAWQSCDSDGAARYAVAVLLPDGRTRFYLELARADGGHDLVTLVGPDPHRAASSHQPSTRVP